jgi:hypothetical protein
MCAVSMVMDGKFDDWYRRYSVPAGPDWTVPLPPPPVVPLPTPLEVEEFRRLLERAREYDRRNGEPDCEMDEKRRKLKSLAEQLGVEIDFV